MLKKTYITIVSPVYKAENLISELVKRIIESVISITNDFEIILVNDCSPDDSWRRIVEECNKDTRVKGINLSRNFGQHFAITAGLDYCTGKLVVVLDCDLQDRPEEIIKLYNKIQQGYDVVFGRRKIRMDSTIKKLFSKLFYLVFDYFTDNKSDNAISNFGIYTEQVIKNYLRFRERNRLFPMIIKWQGFKIEYIDVVHAERKFGKSSYNMLKLLNLAIDIIISQSNKPLKISIKFGFLLSFFSMIYLVYLIVRKFFLDIPLGWTSIMVSIFFIGGLVFANLGLIGLYIGKIFDEVKNRPLYIIKELKGDFNLNNDV